MAESGRILSVDRIGRALAGGILAVSFPSCQQFVAHVMWLIGNQEVAVQFPGVTSFHSGDLPVRPIASQGVTGRLW